MPEGLALTINYGGEKAARAAERGLGVYLLRGEESPRRWRGSAPRGAGGSLTLRPGREGECQRATSRPSRRNPLLQASSFPRPTALGGKPARRNSVGHLGFKNLS